MVAAVVGDLRDILADAVAGQQTRGMQESCRRLLLLDSRVASRSQGDGGEGEGTASAERTRGEGQEGRDDGGQISQETMDGLRIAYARVCEANE